ncbi:MAG: PIN domain nuclease [Planctomycetes bacterium]|nr:PIN domain nuclease [Planctomycetota bacterium]
MGKSFIDTGILVAAADPTDPAKRDRARAVIRSLQSDGLGVVSIQVLEEFYAIATGRLAIEPMIAKALVRDFCHFEVVASDATLLQDAIDLSVLNQLSVSEALVVAAAAAAHCDELLGDRIADGQVIAGVRIVDLLIGDRAQRTKTGTDRRRRQGVRSRIRRNPKAGGHSSKESGSPPETNRFQPELGLEP